MEKKEILLGAHVSIAGGLQNAIKAGEALDCNAIQIFVHSSRSWSVKTLTQKEINLFKNAKENSSIKAINAHSSYLINLGAKDPKIESKSIKTLINEVLICESLDIPYLVIHPGAHVGSGEQVCIKKIAKNLDTVFDATAHKTIICLETTAGQGTNVGYTFEQIEQIISSTKHHKLIGVCIDTCHIFTAGYDLRTKKSYNDVIEHFDKIIGLNKLKVIHLNDCKSDLGAKVDRHENIGHGKIPLETFKLIMHDKRLFDIPKILETPEPADGSPIYEKDLKLLKSL